MKKILLLSTAAFALMFAATGCIEEVEPQNSTITAQQAADAPGSFDNFVNAITSSLAGEFTYSGNSSTDPYDFGYPSFFLQRDVMGQDLCSSLATWFSTWYECSVALGPMYARSQLPWTYYYGWIKNCNTVISLAGENPDPDKKTGAGIAYAMRAMFYMDIAQMFAPLTYTSTRTDWRGHSGKESASVPIVTESTQLTDLAHNPNASNEDMWAFIISDLDKAEELLDGYQRSDKYTPDQSVVYGLKARAYLVMGDYPNAESYAKKAQQGYTMMTSAQYTNRDTGFNTPNSSWMFALTYKANDPNILLNDADSSWGSWMCLEITDVSGCGYAANYGQPFLIDRHLYETIPATDCRKQCFVDFAIDDLSSAAAKIAALSAYSDYPESVYNAGLASDYGTVGGLPLKFRVTGGSDGHNNQYVGFVVAVPLMRVEEMMLIEAEAAGRQAGGEARGIQLLTAFAQQRDPGYTYGTHNEAYGNTSTSQFVNECWWQRRVEFWGEGLATFDIKRLEKGIIRSYPGTNHLETFRWNSTTPPDWMNLCIVQTETNYNYDCTSNPAPVTPAQDSPETTNFNSGYAGIN